jgi:peptidyl-prolyl cis-trans isomerase A (cyclophilin A)
VNRFLAPFSKFALLALSASCLALSFAPGTASAQTSASKAPTHRSTGVHTATDPALFHPAQLRARAPEVYQVKFTTTKGDFVVEVTRAWAPNGADRFYNLVKHGFFTGVSFYRVVPGFVVQFGVSPNPKISAVWDNATIKDDPGKQSNKPGTVTFAQTGQPNSRTTQVFVNLGDNSSLDAQNFPPFGQVTSGMDVIQQFYSGYGDLPEMGGHGPSQAKMASRGKAYLDAEFPKLDSIKSATIISPAPEAPAHKPASHTAAHEPASSSAAPQQ